MRKNNQAKIHLSNAAVKKLKRLFYQSWKSTGKQSVENSSDDDSEVSDSSQLSQREKTDPISVNQSDGFDIELAEKWMRLVTKNGVSAQEILEFYQETFGFKWSTKNDPLEFYQKSEQDMICERKEELESLADCTIATIGKEFGSGYKITMKMLVPSSFTDIQSDQEGQVSVEIEIYIKLWDRCRYPYENPIFFVLSSKLEAVHLFNLTYGLQAEADLEWYGGPMIQKSIDWIIGKKSKRRLADCPSNYVLAKAYNSLEMKKIRPNNGIVSRPKIERTKPIHKIENDTEKDLNNQLYLENVEKLKKKSYKRLSKEVECLPIHKIRDCLIKTIENNPLVIISGETGMQLLFLTQGSGKSTQVPKLILEHYIVSQKGAKCNILVTQPRRIAAIGLAQRVSYENCESVGGSVGYAIRLDSKSGPSTQILYCTTGVLLKKLEQSQSSSSTLNEYSHIVIDEVHERSIDIDFILLILKYLLSIRTDLKVILMSATANTFSLAEYFGGNPPIIHIPGRTYTVENLYLEDILAVVPYSPKGEYCSQNSKYHSDDLEYLANEDSGLSVGSLKSLYPGKSDSVLHSLRKIDQEHIQFPLIKKIVLFSIGYLRGTESFTPNTKPKVKVNTEPSLYRCILIFLPGFQEILKLRNILLADDTIKSATLNGKYCMALHSSVSTSDQRQIFEIPNDGLVKIILSTNIAETSLTIPDVSLVIDCGRMKETRFDSSKGIVSLDTCWISKANALQRSGRAGRICQGKCIRLFSSRRYEKFDSEQTPEIHRTPLEQLLLKIKMLNILTSESLLEVVQRLIEPPPINSVRLSIRALQSLKALTLEESLTPLGVHLGKLPLDIRIGKMLLYGCIFDCLEPILTIAAIMTCKSPFLLSLESRNQNDYKKLDFFGGDSDHITLLNMYNQWMISCQKDHGSQKAFLKENSLSRPVLDMITATRKQLLQYLIDIQFIKSGDIKKASLVTDNLLIKSVLVAALYPNIIQSIPDIPEKPKKYQLFSASGEKIRIHPSSVFKNSTKLWPPFVLYLEKVKTNHIFIRDATLIDPIALVLFGGEVFTNGKKIIMENGWIRITSPNAQLLQTLRKELDTILSQKLENPLLNLNKFKLFTAIKNLVSSGGQKV